MALLSIKEIFVRQVTPSDYRTIERLPSEKPKGGGGQAYFSLSTGSHPAARIFEFGGQAEAWDETERPSLVLPVRAIGTGEVADLQFKRRYRTGNLRYRIANQNRHDQHRHPAFQPSTGFPALANGINGPGGQQIEQLVAGLRIFIVRTVDDEYWGGHCQFPTYPSHWPDDARLRALFSGEGGIENFKGRVMEISSITQRILEAWRSNKNVLLYGPPGTGKTYAMTEIRRLIRARNEHDNEQEGQMLVLDTDDPDDPIKLDPAALPMGGPTAEEWVTFHQSYAYEDFIVGLRPRSGENGVELYPRAGVLLDLALRLESESASTEDDPAPQSAALFIDEVNRGNVSRIFGEFITFMDPAYRGGAEEEIAVAFPTLDCEGATTPPIRTRAGGSVEVTLPWFFPDPIYTVATMNSVDRAVAPLDTALARRFFRIHCGPDLELLARWFDENLEDTRAKRGEKGDLTPGEVTLLLLERLNFLLGRDFGPDFEIGHVYFRAVALAADPASAWARLAQAWDAAIFPQLSERYASRPREFIELLTVSEDGRETDKNFAYRIRELKGSTESTYASPQLTPVRLSDLSDDKLRATLTRLAHGRNLQVDDQDADEDENDV